MSQNNGHPAPDHLFGREIAPGFVEYKGTIPLMELPCEEGASMEDVLWLFHNQDLHRQYQGLVVAVFARQVWGVGDNYTAARDDARKKPGCPDPDKLAILQMVGMPGPLPAGDRDE